MTTRPAVLLTNDDGVDSPLLGQLAASLREVADVWVVAPERQRSAASHAITLHKPLRLHPRGEQVFSLSGTPADCVYVGTKKVVPREVALVVSGPNDGYNLGTDIYYSGTFAGALEGVLRGASGMAVSFAPRATAISRGLALCVELVAHVLAAKSKTLLNVNIPSGEVTSMAWTTLGVRRYLDDIVERQDPWGRGYLWLGGGATRNEPIAGSDAFAVERGLASVTALAPSLIGVGQRLDGFVPTAFDITG